MPRYLDSTAGTPLVTLGAWLDATLKEDVEAYRMQMGYADKSSIEHLCARLTARPADVVRIAIGGNRASLTPEAALAAYNTIQTAVTEGRLAVVSYANALFHPKTIHVVRRDGSSAAYVGSANFTLAGLGRNVESGLVLDTRERDLRGLISEIATAIDGWFVDEARGINRIESHDDVIRLTNNGILGNRDPGSGGYDPVDAHVSRADDATRTAAWNPARRTRSLRPGSSAAPGVVLRWWKKMPSSDAQFTKQGTAYTGKLRLTKSKHAIDPKTFFRDELFGGLPWAVEDRDGKQYEKVIVTFAVRINGVDRGTHNLLVDHGAHRIADQNNIPTVVAWGTLGADLRASDFRNWWVCITRSEDGQFELEITRGPPEGAD